jgi:hypothetical protein
MIIVMNEEAFTLTEAQTSAIRNHPHLWSYFGEEARYAAENMDNPKHEDIICAVLNRGTVWVEDGVFHLADFDGDRFDYAWKNDEWTLISRRVD